MTRGLWVAFTFTLTASAAGASPLTADDCVQVALKKSAQIEEAQAKVQEYAALLSEVESIFYPKLTATGFVAPMFRVAVDGHDINTYERSWKSPSDWGPYTRLEALLAQPLYTFGRAAHGERAASERALVERARLRETELIVALEVRRLYHTRLYALSIIPTLNNAAEIVAEAQEKGRDMFERATGDVTQADLSKLDYAAAEIAKYRRMAEDGAALALSALKHTMGLPESEALPLADSVLPALPPNAPLDLDHLIAESQKLRPEWDQLAHGKEAAAQLRAAESGANLPVLFLAGVFNASWAPSRYNSDNPYHYDPYNELFGGVALGLQLNLDPALAAAKADKAEALGAQVAALARYAATGIPLRVRKAHQEVTRFRALVELAEQSVKASRKWMLFAAAAYTTGTGEARDVLEGVVAYLQAKQGYYESLQSFHVAHAELDFAVGR